MFTLIIRPSCVAPAYTGLPLSTTLWRRWYSLIVSGYLTHSCRKPTVITGDIATVITAGPTQSTGCCSLGAFGHLKQCGNTDELGKLGYNLNISF